MFQCHVPPESITLVRSPNLWRVPQAPVEMASPSPWPTPSHLDLLQSFTVGLLGLLYIVLVSPMASGPNSQLDGHDVHFTLLNAETCPRPGSVLRPLPCDNTRPWADKTGLAKTQRTRCCSYEIYNCDAKFLLYDAVLFTESRKYEAYLWSHKHFVVGKNALQRFIVQFCGL